jgi:hypothetical protein
VSFVVNRSFQANRSVQWQEVEPLNIHKYQTKELLRSCGVPVPEGRVAHTDAHAASIAERTGIARRFGSGAMRRRTEKQRFCA